MEKEIRIWKPDKKKIDKFIEELENVNDICCEWSEPHDFFGLGKISSCSCDECDIEKECNLMNSAFELMKIRWRKEEK